MHILEHDVNSEIVMITYPNEEVQSLKSFKKIKVGQHQVVLRFISGRRSPPLAPGLYEIPDELKKPGSSVVFINTGPHDMCIGIPLRARIRSKDNIPLGIAYDVRVSVGDPTLFFKSFGQMGKYTKEQIKERVTMELKDAFIDIALENDAKVVLYDNGILKELRLRVNKNLRPNFGLSVDNISVRGIAEATKVHVASSISQEQQ